MRVSMNALVLFFLSLLLMFVNADTNGIPNNFNVMIKMSKNMVK